MDLQILANKSLMELDPCSRALSSVVLLCNCKYFKTYVDESQTSQTLGHSVLCNMKAAEINLRLAFANPVKVKGTKTD